MPIGQSPYFLVYGSEAILPADVMWESPAVEQYDEGISKDNRRVHIDSLEEAHCATLIQSARYLEGIRRYHDRNIEECSFDIGDLVLRRIQNTEGLHKISSPWEGLFSVSKVTGPGSYASKHLKAMTSTTRGTSTSCVASTRSRSTTRVQVSMTTHGLFVVSGLSVLALVSGPLFSKIRRQQLLTDLGLLRALRILAVVCKTMYSGSSPYDY
jgi:hypothetical protein